MLPSDSVGRRSPTPLPTLRPSTDRGAGLGRDHERTPVLQIETAAAIARIEGKVERIETSVERIEGKIERLVDVVTDHGFASKQLQAAERKRGRRAGAVLRWGAGIVAGVMVGVIMFLVKR